MTLLSIHGGTHPIIWNDKTHRNEYSEFLRPLRFACDGDMGLAVARFICDYIGNMEDICVYCFSHEDSDTCLKYWFPIQRHARLQSINYTMYRHMSFQICLSCFQRFGILLSSSHFSSLYFSKCICLQRTSTRWMGAV